MSASKSSCGIPSHGVQVRTLPTQPTVAKCDVSSRLLLHPLGVSALLHTHIMAYSCELSKLAYSKIILHAFKYPHTAINGVLLANEGSNRQSVKYVDAIPLFHHNLGLAPMLEVALMQVVNNMHYIHLKIRHFLL